MEVLSKDRIRQWILPALTFSSHGRPSVVEPSELVEAILYKLKSGCQWRYLPVKQFFTGACLTWQGVYARFNAWRKDGSWQTMWGRVLHAHRAHLDCSSVQLDGSHTPAKNGGEAVGYQGRKKARTTTALFVVDNQGQPLACASRWPVPARRRANTPTATACPSCSGSSAPRSRRPALPWRACF